MDDLKKALNKKPPTKIVSYKSKDEIKEVMGVKAVILDSCYLCGNKNNEGSVLIKTKTTALGIHGDCKSYIKKPIESSVVVKKAKAEVPPAP